MASLADLAAVLGVPARAVWSRIEVSGVSDDSRDVKRGELFVAIPGARYDGADYVEDALMRGAVAIVSERPCTSHVPNLVVPDARSAVAEAAAAIHGHPTRSLFTVGVTGTNGKTTVCHVTAHLLGEEATSVIGTVANEARGLQAVTTPKSAIIQQIAHDALRIGRRNLVIEASSIGLAQHRLDAVDCDVAVFTNLSRDHYDLHGSREAYLSAKAVLFRSLKPDAMAVVNATDEASGQILEASAGRSLTFAVDRNADLVAYDVYLEGYASRFCVEWRGADARVELPLPGRHNVENALAAIGVGLAAEKPLDMLCAALSSVSSVPGRCEVFRRPGGPTAVVDFAHTPNALEYMLQLLRPNHLRMIVVFGCPGESDRGKRRCMGEIAGRFADVVLLTSDNPKHEDPESIVEDIAIGLGDARGQVERVLDRAEAIRQAVDHAAKGDVILVAGKGHETYQIVEDRFEPHSDAGILRDLGFVPLRGGRA